MSRISILVILLTFLSITCYASNDHRSCKACHQGIEHMDRNHDFLCLDCHILPEDRGYAISDHDKIVRHPSAPEHVKTFCGECHQEDIATLQNSVHYTFAGIIGQTRYLWGAQEGPYSRHSPSNHPKLSPMPRAALNPETTADLVDDLLTRRCFKCHLGSLPPGEKGFYRGLGCAACHVFYADDGIYRGSDKAMQGKTGYPLKHVFAKPIPVKQCLHCHNGNNVGADFVGMFEHDYHRAYRTPWRNGGLPEPVYMMDHHYLSPDIHYQRGLICVDCHGRGDVMGRGDLSAHGQASVTVRCVHCHEPERDATGEKLITASDREKEQFRDKQGQWHRLPKRRMSIVEHRIEGMERVHCLGCHAAWGFHDYGLSLIRDDRRDLSRWESWYLQGDERVLNIFNKKGQFPEHFVEPGPWFLAWGFRRWEYQTLGVDADKRIVPFRPRYQYMVSYVNGNGEVILDSVIPQRGDKSGIGWAYMPFYPHTVRKRGRSCESCHRSDVAAGRGIWKGKGLEPSLTKPNPPVYQTLRLLKEQEVKRLTGKTLLYRQYRFHALNGRP